MIAIYYGATVDDKYRNIIKFTINSICEFFDYNIIVIDPKKSNKLTKLLNNDKIKFVKYNFDDEKCWSALISKCENILEQNNIEKVIYFRTPIIGNFKRDNYGLITSYENEAKKGNDTFSFNFNTTKNLLFHYMFVKSCHNKNVEFYQIFTDVQEVPFGEVLKFKRYKKLYLANTEDFICMPAFEYGLANENKNKVEKEIDFCFYCTAFTEDRNYIREYKDYLENHDNFDCRIVYEEKAKNSKSEKSIKQEDYDDKLAKAKFTLAIPAYDVNHFSIWRIFEALKNDCLCLVLSNCNMYDLENTYPKIYKIIKENCIVDSVYDIEKRINEIGEKYIDIIRMLKETDEYKKITNLKYCSDRWKKMLREE